MLQKSSLVYFVYKLDHNTQKQLCHSFQGRRSGSELWYFMHIHWISCNCFMKPQIRSIKGEYQNNWHLESIFNSSTETQHKTDATGISIHLAIIIHWFKHTMTFLLHLNLLEGSLWKLVLTIVFLPWRFESIVLEVLTFSKAGKIFALHTTATIWLIFTQHSANSAVSVVEMPATCWNSPAWEKRMLYHVSMRHRKQISPFFQ